MEFDENDQMIRTDWFGKERAMRIAGEVGHDVQMNGRRFPSPRYDVGLASFQRQRRVDVRKQRDSNSVALLGPHFSCTMRD
jgi:hypothetical protein